MSVLPALDLARISTWFMRNSTSTAGFTKADLAAAVTATDSWIDTNQANFNAALPSAFRTNASLAQKTLLFCAVAMRRAGIAKVAEDG